MRWCEEESALGEMQKRRPGVMEWDKIVVQGLM